MVTAQVSCAYSPQDSLALVIVPLHPLGAWGFGWGEAEGEFTWLAVSYKIYSAKRQRCIS